MYINHIIIRVFLHELVYGGIAESQTGRQVADTKTEFMHTFQAC